MANRSELQSVQLNSTATSFEVDEDAAYAAVAAELESGNTDKGLWIRIYAECDGDEQKTKVAYIKQRAEKIITAERVRMADMERERMAYIEQSRIEEKRIRQMTLPNRLRHGLVPADVAAKESGGMAEHFLSACVQGSQDVEVMLGQFPTLVAAIDSDGNTGLHLAVLRKHEHLVKSLIEHGACIYIRNGFGQTPQDVATVGGMNISDYPAYKKIFDLIASTAKAMEVD